LTVLLKSQLYVLIKTKKKTGYVSRSLGIWINLDKLFDSLKGFIRVMCSEIVQLGHAECF